MSAEGVGTMDQKPGPGRRSSWIGVDYFQALRNEKDVSAEEFRRIPAHVNNILCVRHSPDAKMFGIATADGSLGLYDAASGNCIHYIHKTATASPATSLKFRENVAFEAEQNVLLAVYTNGHITQWNFKTGEKIRHLVETDNQILTTDYRYDCQQFATGGKDRVVRVYDEVTGNVVTTLEGHSNRVFALRFNPRDENVLLSGGWDDTVKIWDTRSPVHQGLLFGPHLAGEALDIHGDEVLTGSWGTKEPIQIWDMRTRKVKDVVPWKEPAVYTAQFSKLGALKVAAGGVKPDQFRIFERDGFEEIYAGDTEGTYSLDFSPATHQVVAAGAGNTVSVFDLKNREDRDFAAIGFRKVPKT